jgi:hypothetical protein
VQAVLLPDVVDGEDVRVIQGGDGARLALETRDALRVGDEVGGEDFEGHAAAEPFVAREVDLAHAARAERALDAVDPEPAADERRAAAAFGRGLARQSARRHAHRRALDEVRGPRLGFEQAQDFAAQLRVRAARRRDEALALRRGQFVRGVEQLVNPLPALRFHQGYSPPSRR